MTDASAGSGVLSSNSVDIIAARTCVTRLRSTNGHARWRLNP
jgi:hypothetical protein